MRKIGQNSWVLWSEGQWIRQQSKGFEPCLHARIIWGAFFKYQLLSLIKSEWSVCVYPCVFECWTHVYACVYVSVCAYIYTHIYPCMCMYVYMSLCVHVCMSLCVHVYICLCVCTCIYVPVCARVCICHVYIPVHAHMQLFSQHYLQNHECKSLSLVKRDWASWRVAGSVHDWIKQWSSLAPSLSREKAQSDF